MLAIPFMLILGCIWLCSTVSFQLSRPCMRTRPFVTRKTSTQSLQMIEFQGDTASYVGIFVVTLIPSLLLVNFVGNQADSSRDKLSENTKARFKRAMMEQPGANLSLPTSEEEAIKKQIAKAYIQDKDVDVAVLEEKLRKRAQWRKEMMAQAKANANSLSEDDEGW